MALLFFILILISSVILALFVLVQNPKGGGLSGTFGGINNQFMGVKQTNDVLEKGTWIFASLIGILCIVSVLFINTANTGNDNNMLNKLPVSTSSAPATQQSAPPVTAQPAAPKKP